MNKLLDKAKKISTDRMRLNPSDDELEVIVALLNGEVSNKAAAAVLGRDEKTLNAYMGSYIKVGLKRGLMELTFKKKAK